MSAPIRVLVVDDSVVVRRVLARAIEAEPGFAVAGTANDGRAGLEKMRSTRPDVVLLDLEMPDVDGFDVLRELRSRSASSPPVVVFSHLSEEGAPATLDAMALGAVGFVLKPTTAQGLGLVEEYVAEEVLPLLRGIVESERAAPQSVLAHTTPPRSTAPVAAVTVAVSTGGPNALAEVVAGLPDSFPVPIIIVQHMPAAFMEHLAVRLDRIGSVRAHVAIHGEPLRPGNLYLAPGGRHLAVERGGSVVRAVLNDQPPENSCRPAGDVLFRSAAAAYGNRLLAVVMTGMGRDGLRGAEAIHAAGGTVIVQDAATSVVNGMPGSVVTAGLADAVVPLPDLAAELVRRTTRT